MKQRFREKLAIVTCLALALSVFNPLTSQAAVKAPSSAVGYLTSSEEYASCDFSFRVTGMKSSEQIKLSSVKSSDESVAEVDRLRGAYYFESSKVKDSYCEISLTGHKAGSTTISYKVGKTTKKTKVTVKKYVNPVKKITLTGVNDGKDFSSLTKDKSYVYPETNYETGESTTPFTVKETKNPVLEVTPASGWSITDIGLNLGNDMYESYYKYDGKKYSGAQKFTLYKLFAGAENVNVELVNEDGGKMTLRYELKPWG